MIISHKAMAGTLESSDLLVEVEPWEKGVEIEIDSIVKKQYGEAIEETVREVLMQYDIQNVKVYINDRGALDCTVRARVETALLRGTKKG